MLQAQVSITQARSNIIAAIPILHWKAFRRLAAEYTKQAADMKLDTSLRTTSEALVQRLIQAATSSNRMTTCPTENATLIPLWQLRQTCIFTTEKSLKKTLELTILTLKQDSKDSTGHLIPQIPCVKNIIMFLRTHTVLRIQ